MIEFVFILLMVGFTVTAQLLLKKGAGLMPEAKQIGVILKNMLNKYIIAGAIVILIAPIFYLLALSRMELGIAFSFTGLNYVFVVIGAFFIFKEEITKYRCIGVLTIFFGIIIYNL